MPAKRPKSAKAAAARNAKSPSPELTPDEVSSFEQQLKRHQQSEKAWQRLTAPPEDDDRWTAEVEEGLVYKNQRQDHAERRWKYFSK